ncbi:MAG TPA: GGDEF domain-containing protein [Dehalococcoidia bacterium]|nr:GGDEF domain-containing protein [Dehalococcoidia bacterium]
MAATEWSTRSLEARARRMEHIIAWVRVLVVPTVLVAFYLWPERTAGQTLAVSIKAPIDFLYAVVVLACRPWRSPRLRMWSIGTALYDGLALVTHVFLTGGASSPFVPYLIAALAAATMRFGVRGVAAAGAALTAPLAVALVVEPGGSEGRFATLMNVAAMWFVGIGLTAVRREEDRQHEENLRLALETAKTQAELEIANWRANTDGLTGLANHSAFHTALADAVRGGRDVAVVYVDLDGFKRVNDAFGHHAGDEVLRSFARAMRDAAPEAAVVARLGGDEFAALLLDDHAGRAAEVADRVRAICVTSASEPVVASVGTAELCCCRSPVALLRRADERMYEEKRRRKETQRQAA